jgi:hypothetical protein
MAPTKAAIPSANSTRSGGDGMPRAELVFGGDGR